MLGCNKQSISKKESGLLTSFKFWLLEFHDNLHLAWKRFRKGTGQTVLQEQNTRAAFTEPGKPQTHQCTGAGARPTWAK